MKYYELTYLLSPELSEEAVKTFQEKISSSIQERGGVLEKAQPAIKKRLGYPIQKKSQAYLTTLNFHLNQEQLSDFEKNLKSEGQVLRYLILTKKLARIISKLPEKPVVPKKPKALPAERPAKVELKDIEKKLEEILGE